MANLLHVDRSREGGFLRIVALEVNTMLLVRDLVCCDRWVMAEFMLETGLYRDSGYEPDLLRNQLCSASLIYPFPQEELAQEGVQRFLLISKLVTSTSILLLQCAQEPLQHQ